MNELEQSSLVARILKLRQEGKTSVPIAQEVGISRYQVEKILRSDEYKEYAAKVAEKIEAEITLFEVERHKQLSAKLWALDSKVVKTIEKNLDEGKIQAVDTWARLAINKEKKEEKSGDNNLTIVMPGAEEKPVIEVKSDDIGD